MRNIKKVLAAVVAAAALVAAIGVQSFADEVEATALNSRSEQDATGGMILGDSATDADGHEIDLHERTEYDEEYGAEVTTKITMRASYITNDAGVVTATIVRTETKRWTYDEEGKEVPVGEPEGGIVILEGYQPGRTPNQGGEGAEATAVYDPMLIHVAEEVYANASKNRTVQGVALAPVDVNALAEKLGLESPAEVDEKYDPLAIIMIQMVGAKRFHVEWQNVNPNLKPGAVTFVVLNYTDGTSETRVATLNEKNIWEMYGYATRDCVVTTFVPKV